MLTGRGREEEDEERVAERTMAVALAAASASASELLWLPSNAASSATNFGVPASSSEVTLARLGEEERFSDEPRSPVAPPTPSEATPSTPESATPILELTGTSDLESAMPTSEEIAVTSS